MISENVFHTVGGIAYENKYEIYCDLTGSSLNSCNPITCDPLAFPEFSAFSVESYSRSNQFFSTEPWKVVWIVCIVVWILCGCLSLFVCAFFYYKPAGIHLRINRHNKINVCWINAKKESGLWEIQRPMDKWREDLTWECFPDIWGQEGDGGKKQKKDWAWQVLRWK